MHDLLLVTHPKGVALFEKRQYPRNKHLFCTLFRLLKCDDLHISVCIFLRPLFSIGKKRHSSVAELLIRQITYRVIGLLDNKVLCVFNSGHKNIRWVVNTLMKKKKKKMMMMKETSSSSSRFCTKCLHKCSNKQVNLKFSRQWTQRLRYFRMWGHIMWL
jgi:hypothetical protein